MVDMVFGLLIALIAAVAIILLRYRRSSDKRRIKDLEKRFVELSRMPKHIAEETLDREVETLKQKFPNREVVWYLEKAIYDLERDKSG